MEKTPDGFFEHLFERMPGPLYVVEATTRVFHKVNPACASLLDTVPAEIEGRTAKDFVCPEDWDKVTGQLQSERTPGQRVSFEFRALTAKGRVLPLGVSVIPLGAPWDDYEVGILHDASAEKKLESEVARQRENTLRAFQSNTRIWHITEMIRAAFTAMEELASAKTIDSLLGGAVRLLTSNTGWDFRSATIYLKEGDRLVVACSEGDSSARAITLNKNGRLARFFRESEGEKDLRLQDTIIPLRGRDENIGLIRLVEHGKQDKDLLTEPVQRMRESVLRTLANTLSLMMRNIKLYKKVEEQSTIDPLTRTYNRRYFDKKFIEELDRAVRYKHPLSVVMLDIDHFKEVNDVHGHLQGDRILQELGELIQTRIRKSDVLCRFGGEEFIVLLPMAPLSVSARVAEEVRELIEKFGFTNVSGEKNLHLTVSLGVTCYSPVSAKKKMTGNQLVAIADNALYKAKTEGRNRVVLGKEAS